jgi:hypothetical protein
MPSGRRGEASARAFLNTNKAVRIRDRAETRERVSGP